MTDTQTVVEEIQKGFHDFKESNNTRLDNLEKGAQDILDEIKVDKINEHISELQEKVAKGEALEEKFAKLEASIKVPAASDGQKQDEGLITEYKSAFVDYVRSGSDSGLRDLEKKALSVGTDTEGGFLITPEMTGIVNGIFVETSPMRSIASVQSISTDSLELPIKTTRAAASTRSEKGSVSETAAVQFSLKTIPTHEVFAEPAITQKMLDDSQIDIEAYVAKEIGDEISVKENTAFITGSGVGEARGFLALTGATPAEGSNTVEEIASGSSGTFDGDDVIDLYYTLKDKYINSNTRFVCSRATEKLIRKLKEGSSNEYIYSFDSEGKCGQAMGVNIVRFDDMAAPAADSLSLAIGDFSEGYQIVDRLGIRTIRDNVTSKGFIKYYTTKRYGGDVRVAEAIKVLKLGS